MDKFINIECTPENMDIYLVRHSVKKALCKAMSLFNGGVLLDIGCGEMPYKEYILKNSKITSYLGLDIENPRYQQKTRPDIFWDGVLIPMPDNSVDYVIATEFFEHIYDAKGVLREVFRVLKPDGFLFFTVPFLWPLHTVPHDYFRYTPFSLKEMFLETGFLESNIYPHGGWDGALAQMIGLWVNRSTMDVSRRAEMRKMFFPLYKELLDKDNTSYEFAEQSMFTGLFGFAFKAKIQKLQKYHIFCDKTSKDDIILRLAKSIAIFGCGVSGKKTLEFILEEYGEKIKYIIDDSELCECKNISTVSTDSFLTREHKYTDLLVFGREQKLNPKLLNELQIPYLRLENIF